MFVFVFGRHQLSLTDVTETVLNVLKKVLQDALVLLRQHVEAAERLLKRQVAQQVDNGQVVAQRLEVNVSRPQLSSLHVREANVVDGSLKDLLHLLLTLLFQIGRVLVRADARINILQRFKVINESKPNVHVAGITRVLQDFLVNLADLVAVSLGRHGRNQMVLMPLKYKTQLRE